MRGDSLRLEEAFLNVLLNAAEACQDASGLIRIRASLASSLPDASEPRSNGDFVRIDIEDNGHGIPPENLPRIFEPFFTTKTEGKHTGLGLTAAFGIIRDHGGAIVVDSRSGRGTVVSVFLPLGNEPSSLVPATIEGRPPRRILVVDDQEFVGEMLRDVLEANGFAAIYESSSKRALQNWRLSKNKADLILVDLKMPEMDGRQFIREIRKLGGSVPIVALSGYSEAHQDDAELMNMTNWYIKKPFTNDELIETVENLLSARPDMADGDDS